MDYYYSTTVPKKITFKIKNCKCSCHENRIRKGLKKIGEIELISINFKQGTYTVSALKNPIYVIQALQNVLRKEIKLVQQGDYVGSKDRETDIRFDMGDQRGASGSNHGYGSVLLLSFPDVRPSAPVLPLEEAYGYPVVTRPTASVPQYYCYYGSGTSSDDYPKDYQLCTVM